MNHTESLPGFDPRHLGLASSQGFLVVMGHRGIGKSTLMLRLEVPLSGGPRFNLLTKYTTRSPRSDGEASRGLVRHMDPESFAWRARVGGFFLYQLTPEGCGYGYDVAELRRKSFRPGGWIPVDTVSGTGAAILRQFPASPVVWLRCAPEVVAQRLAARGLGAEQLAAALGSQVRAAQAQEALAQRARHLLVVDGAVDCGHRSYDALLDRIRHFVSGCQPLGAAA
ncbi:MAG: hypothetical protein H7831_00110 [Magnetococcus sp. WYHC-3]